MNDLINDTLGGMSHLMIHFGGIIAINSLAQIKTK